MAVPLFLTDHAKLIVSVKVDVALDPPSKFPVAVHENTND